MGREGSRVAVKSQTNASICFGKITPLTRKHPQHVQGVEVAVVLGEDDIVERFRLGKVAGLVSGDRLPEGCQEVCRGAASAGIKLVSGHGVARCPCCAGGSSYASGNGDLLV